MKLSIVTTMYYSSLYIDEFYNRIIKEVLKIADDYEIIFVDDGSPDDSLQKSVKLYERDKRVKVIELSRNFGHHKAIMTGLSHAKGEFVFLIDSDLEEEPELLSKFWNKLQKDKSIDVVYGVQESRKGRWFERWSGKVYYKIINKLGNISIPQNIITARIMKRSYVNALIQYKEREFWLAGAWIDTGFNQQELIVYKHSHSETTYSFTHKINLLVKSLTSFSNYPLKLIFYMGSFISVFSILYIIFLLFQKFIYQTVLSGWTSLIVSIWLLGGLILMSMGIIGLYISKIFIETKQRPFTIIKKIYGR